MRLYSPVYSRRKQLQQQQKAETLGIYLLSFFTYIFVRPKAAVSTFRRDAGEEGVSMFPRA